MKEYQLIINYFNPSVSVHLGELSSSQDVKWWEEFTAVLQLLCLSLALLRGCKTALVWAGVSLQLSCITKAAQNKRTRANLVYLF